MLDYFWPNDELSLNEQWAIVSKHVGSLSVVDQVKAGSAVRTFLGLTVSGAAIGVASGLFFAGRLRRSRLKIANMLNNP